MNSTCLSFPVALQFAAGLLQGGVYKTILIVSSEIASRALPWKDAPAVAGLFGDGAAAAVIRRDDTSGIVASRFIPSRPASMHAVLHPAAHRFDFHKEFELFSKNSLFMMDGKELFG